MEEIPFSCSVSSVFNGDNANYGKKYLYDKSDETCWQSSTQLPHTISCKLLPSNENIENGLILRVQFQGGFVGTHLLVNDSVNLYPLNNNNFQEFNIVNGTIDNNVLKIEILKSSDFYGRIIIYHLQIFSL